MSDNYISSIKHALKNAEIRLGWYSDTSDVRHLSESMEWIDVAQIYMKEIKNNNE